MSTTDRVITPHLEPYEPSLTLAGLAVGVDNLRYDVYLSPRCLEQAREYLFEQILHQGQPYLGSLYPSDSRRRNMVATEFRAQLGSLLRESLHRAKEQNNIEVDLLARLAILHWLRGELQRQFSQLVITCKERAEQRGSEMVRGSMHAFVLNSKLAEFQSHRRHILNDAGEKLFELFEQLEESHLQPARLALFGSAFAERYQVLRNRLVFLENPSDAVVNLQHYVMLGHFRGDVDDEEKVFDLMASLLQEKVLEGPHREELSRLEVRRQKAVEHLQAVNRRLRELESQIGSRQGPATGRSGMFSWLDNFSGRSESASGHGTTEQEARDLETRRLELISAVDEADRQLAFLEQQERSRLESALSNPLNAERLFGPVSSSGAPLPRSSAQDAMLHDLFERLEQAGVLRYIVASYHLKPFFREFCPPLNPQQVKQAVVSRRNWVEFEGLLAQYPTQDWPIEKLEEMARRLRRVSRRDAEGVLSRFAGDLMRLRRDQVHLQHLTGLFAKIHLVGDEKTRQLSRMNRTLHEFLLPGESEIIEERLLTHVVIKADVRDSTGITEELLRRELNPASHLSLHFYEPVRKLMTRYSAAKIFIEGDALILGIYETESNRSSQRPVAKACLLAKEIVEVCQVYNQRARENDLPVLELGLGVAYHDAPPHYWEDGESRIMISAALNESDRLASCTRLARRLLGEDDRQFHVFLFEAYPVFGGAEAEEEALVQYNVMGVALSAPGFHKLREEIALSPLRMSGEVLGQRESITLYGGTVPLGNSFEKLIIREARAPRVLLPGGHVEQWTDRVYYEVCVDSRLYEEPATPASERSTL